MLIYQDLEMTS